MPSKDKLLTLDEALALVDKALAQEPDALRGLFQDIMEHEPVTPDTDRLTSEQ